MVLKAFLMAESSSLLRAPLRNWFGWCFTTRLFRGLSVGVGSKVVVVVECVGSGVGSCLGIVGTGRILGVGVAVVTMVVVGVECVGSEVASRLGIVGTGRILGVGVAVVATVVVGVE
jgi:hypothetical protein